MMNNEVDNKQAGGYESGCCKSGAGCKPGFSDKASCKCVHHLIWPMTVIGLGLVMLFSALGVIAGAGAAVVLSLLVIVLGVSMVVKRFCRCCCK